MATKTAQPKPLTEAQADHVVLLVEKLNEAQAKANKFVTQYAAEHGVTLGKDGWVFDQNAMQFVQMPAPQNGNAQEGD